MDSVEDRIADATLRLLRSGGPRAVTVEAVAAASGVAKTTIYRRYRDRREVLSVALSRVATPQPIDTGAPAAERLLRLTTQAVEAVTGGVGLGGVAAMLTDDDPEFLTLFRRILAQQRAELEAVIDAGKATGEVRPDLDNAALLDAIVGGYLAEHARTGAVAPGWEQRLFVLLWPAVQPGG